MGRLTILR